MRLTPDDDIVVRIHAGKVSSNHDARYTELAVPKNRACRAGHTLQLEAIHRVKVSYQPELQSASIILNNVL